MSLRTPALRRSRSTIDGNFEATRRWFQIIRLIYNETPQTETTVFQRILTGESIGTFSGAVLLQTVISILKRLYPERDIRRENGIKLIQKLLADGLVAPLAATTSKLTFSDNPKTFYTFTKTGVQTYMPNGSGLMQRTSSTDRTPRTPEAFWKIKRRINRFVSPRAKSAAGLRPEVVEKENTKEVGQSKNNNDETAATKTGTPFTRLRNSFNRKKDRGPDMQPAETPPPMLKRSESKELVDVPIKSSTPVLLKYLVKPATPESAKRLGRIMSCGQTAGLRPNNENPKSPEPKIKVLQPTHSNFITPRTERQSRAITRDRDIR